VTLFITEENGTGVVDISTDRAVVWTRNVDGSKIAPGLGGPAPTVTADGAKDQHVEVYLEGHVEIRQATTRGPEAGLTKLLLADQAYYDVTRNVALLLNAELITRPFKAPAEIHLRAQEIRGTSKTRFEASNATIFSSRLPSDPDLTIQMAEATFEERRIPAKGLFGRPLFDPLGRPREINQLWFTGEDTTFNLLGVPFFYLPHAEDDARNPTGPLDNVRFRTDRIFGTGLLVDWDLFQLLGANTHPDNTRWKLQTDYLSARGPGLGTVFTTHGWDLFDLPGRYDTLARAYVMYDGGTDFLGGPREFDPPRDLRGRTLLRHYQEIGEDVTFQGQFAYLSDRNFLEQYYKNEFDTDYNQETFLYLKKQHDNYAGTLLLEPRLRWWVTETQWLPRADGAWLGESFFDRFTYYARASAG
jgi:hypothetical protein